MARDAESEIIARLDTIVNLLTRLCISAEVQPKLTDQVRLLSEIGLTNAQMAGVIHRESNYVTSTLSQQKKRSKAEGGKK